MFFRARMEEAGQKRAFALNFASQAHSGTWCRHLPGCSETSRFTFTFFVLVIGTKLVSISKGFKCTKNTGKAALNNLGRIWRGSTLLRRIHPKLALPFSSGPVFCRTTRAGVPV
jgi:hypothetical protein